MSLKGDKYETTEEVKARLEGTVVLYDGRPVYIKSVQMPGLDDGKEVARVFFDELPLGGGQKSVRKFLSSRKFDLSPFKLGYVNYNGEAVFLSRAPIRQYKQGLSPATLTITRLGSARAEGRRNGGLDFSVLLRTSVFSDVINNKYPSFKEAGERLGDQDCSSVAISRSFAFKIDHDLESLFLMHKGVRCGWAVKGEKGLTLPPKYQFLREEAEAHGIPVVK